MFEDRISAGLQLAKELAELPMTAPVVLALNAAAIYIGAAVGTALGGLVIAGYGLTAVGMAGGIAALFALLHLLLSLRLPPPSPAPS